MDFNKFYKKFRNTPEYDLLIEGKNESVELSVFKTKELVAIFYANELYDCKLNVKQILTFFDKQYHLYIINSLVPRMKPPKIAVAWMSIKKTLRDIEKHNSKINDRPYYDNIYPSRIIRNP